MITVDELEELGFINPYLEEEFILRQHEQNEIAYDIKDMSAHIGERNDMVYLPNCNTLEDLKTLIRISEY